MKRVKMMLLSLLVLGAVAGTLAFKARFDARFCTSPVRIVNGVHTCAAQGVGNVACPNLIPNVTTQPDIAFNKWCTTTPNFATATPTCPTTCLTTVYSLDDDGQ